MNATYFAQRAFVGGAGEPVFFTSSQRLKHVLILGKSGTGKSSLLKTLFLADVREGRGAMLIDPHGDLAEDLLFHIPRYRVEDTILFEPGHRDNPASINLLDNADPDMRSVIADNVVGLLLDHWGVTGPRLEQILRHSLISLLDFPEHTTILGVGRLLTDESYRRRVVSQTENPITRAFWTDQFERYNNRFRIEAVTPVLNRLEKLTSDPLMRNILGVPKSTINIRRIMERDEILIANLSAGAIGKNAADMLGSILLGLTEIAALERHDIPEKERAPFQIYLDEATGFSASRIASMIGQVRKFGVGLTIATQSLSNYPEEMQTALLSCGTLAAYRVAGRDAQLLDIEYDREIPPEAFSSLEPFQAYLKMPDGSLPFRAFISKPPSYYRRRRPKQIRKASRAQFTRPRAVVEAKIDRWMGERIA